MWFYKEEKRRINSKVCSLTCFGESHDTGLLRS